ncbi:MAG: hypothetical protein RBR42_11400 [Desulfomicrobium sp.]|jgi:hypothetical protein|nr:hypothetical protein [Desulfomicrobium sp.]NLV97010.1 hypothetical protein [Desulfovibrionales bacterium]
MIASNTVLHEIAEVFHFEFWLRYYFIEERDTKLYISLTEEQAKQMKTQFPDYWEMVESMLERSLSPELSQRVVVEFIQLNMAGKKFPVNVVPKIFDTKDFSIEMILFNTWVDLHEEQLMKKIYSFDYWINAYQEWKESDQAKTLALSLTVQLQQESQAVN